MLLSIHLAICKVLHAMELAEQVDDYFVMATLYILDLSLQSQAAQNGSFLQLTGAKSSPEGASPILARHQCLDSGSPSHYYLHTRGSSQYILT